jgi:hypothetical protein
MCALSGCRRNGLMVGEKRRHRDKSSNFDLTPIRFVVYYIC